jgi:hypothetical protein
MAKCTPNYGCQQGDFMGQQQNDSSKQNQNQQNQKGNRPGSMDKTKRPLGTEREEADQKGFHKSQKTGGRV